MLLHEYMKYRSGYSLEAGACWVRVYGSSPGDAPLVVCEGVAGEIPDTALSQIAAETIERHFPDGLSELPRPLLWIERVRSRRSGRSRFYFVSFESYRPRPVSVGFTSRVTLGGAVRYKLSAEEVEALIGEKSAS
ncbi:hypothetical protein [Rubrobacter indicoceani]|uniref:hypothetical protein n=1 Tax=Rubrobacter indicoceani TaxID=2051957 RepID=UPI000E5B9EC4|nr:hypothetical protein [Rubrobacter indicoceani]